MQYIGIHEIRKIQILSHQSKIDNSIEIFSGMVDKQENEVVWRR